MSASTYSGVDSGDYHSLATVWRTHLAVFTLACVLLVFLYWDVIRSLVSVWWSDDTYGHGFLIFPISLYLVYQNRKELLAVYPSYQFSGAVLAGAVSLMWLIAKTLHIVLLQQVLLIGFLAAIVWATLGWKVLGRLLFPLFFLFFSMPIWDLLVTTTLQGITAAVASSVLGMLGVPVLSEGHFITIPAGVFQVETTCAGTRYFIAGLTLSVLFVHIAYRAYYKKAIFLIVAILLTVVVNSLRVIMVIMAGHLTDMQHPWVHEHISLGWWLFMACIIPLFWIGMRYMDPLPEPDASVLSMESGRLALQSPEFLWRKSGAILVVLFVMLSLGPLLADISQADRSGGELRAAPPVLNSSWRGPETYKGSWQPSFIGADNEVAVTYQYHEDSAFVNYYSAQYVQQQQGKELASSVNMMYDKEVWQEVPGGEVSVVRLKGVWPYEVNEVIIRPNEGEEMMVWQWYSVAGHTSASRNKAKMFELLKFFGPRKESMAFAVGVPAIDYAEARLILKKFLEDMGGGIVENIEN